ncbi:16S rRNA (guanine(966)-N(2))-methyltransferase RsmD [Herbiconiux sp. KACC 21604]|uniref:16S rRNA (guanine(966)-N(2))-methyltransferase RsmD n=1 Tax=unclassified Herbiconiux TaxID=2618217 RepID=UPI0014926DEA|nr:16S rRNA (guanine(966)-N(2))-methyltransferase RsmD [Herbiconiux sp. SALV-R1]QJU54076.1 16S rRNA (guanine(966)-N(2))-methyltransferase RsmD [Herbiconiux sp. SALV-R1]WPO85120.1 16S rRNA (guanine(966)-N(2))-methyltransferase RsmD [Herbiconiux sp. KACC 21604]
MTRIIGGAAGSLTLAVPRSGTRPTSDRVREAIFSALDARGGLDGLRVLDLYAGSGALGLEALSRGAATVTLVERNAGAARVARQNAATVERAVRAAGTATDAAPARVDVAAQAVQQYLRGLPVVPGAGFDVVFLDPPYELDETELGADLELLVPLLDPDATVLVERSSRSPGPRWPRGLELDRSKAYGETVLWWASPTTPSAEG